MATHVGDTITGGVGRAARSSSRSLQPRVIPVLFDRGTRGSCVSLAYVVGKWVVEGGRRSRGNARRVSQATSSFCIWRGMAGFAVTAYEDQTPKGLNRGNRAGTIGGDQGQAPAKNRVGGRPAKEGGTRSPAPPGSRDLLHCEFSEDAGHRRVGQLTGLVGLRPSGQQPLQILLSMRLFSCWILRSSAVGPDA